MGKDARSITKKGEGQSVPFSLEFGELDIPTMCMGCKRMHRGGILITIGARCFLLCVRCMAGQVYQYQSRYPHEVLIEVDTHIESGNFKNQLEECIGESLRDYKVSSTDRANLVDAIQRIFDGDKFDMLGKGPTG